MCIAYYRVSGDAQRRDGNSLAEQQEACRQYIARQQGSIIGPEFLDVDSGGKAGRTQYQRMLEMLRHLREEGRVVVVVVKNLDRFGRNMPEATRAWEEIAINLKIQIHSVDLGGAVPEIVFNSMLSVAREQVRLQGEKIRGVKQFNARNGYQPGSTAPWGFLWRDATTEERASGAPKRVMDVDPDQGPYVKTLFERFADGDSVRKLMRWIATLPPEARGLLQVKKGTNSGEHKTRQRSLGGSALRWILTNATYVGETSQGTPAKWPAIVDVGTFVRVQERLDSHKKLPLQASQKYLLTGLVKCPACLENKNKQVGMVGQTLKTKRGDATRNHQRYLCSSAFTSSDGAASKCYSTAQMESLDSSVLEQVATVLAPLTNEKLRPLLARAWRRKNEPAGDSANTTREIHKLESEIEARRLQLHGATAKYSTDQIGKTEYDSFTAHVMREMQEMQERIATLEGRERSRDAQALPQIEVLLQNAKEWEVELREASIQRKRELLSLFIDRVVPVKVAHGKFRAEIAWNPMAEQLRDIASTS